MNNKYLAGISFSLIVASAIASQASANPLQASDVAAPLPSSFAMSEGGRTSAPLGHIILCLSIPSECQTRSVNMSYKNTSAIIQRASTDISFSASTIPWLVDPVKRMSIRPVPEYAPVKLTKKIWAQLDDVNKRINKKITPRADGSKSSDDLWSTTGRYGDCEDYVIQKRAALIKMGWPSDSVLITLADHPRFGAHAVLIARTDKGDFVLDNMNNKVKAWDQVNYTWEKRQSRQNPAKWVSLNNKVPQFSRMASYLPVKRKVPTPAIKPQLVTPVAVDSDYLDLETAIPMPALEAVYEAPAIGYSATAYEAQVLNYSTRASVTRQSTWDKWSVKKFSASYTPVRLQRRSAVFAQVFNNDR